MSSSTDAAEDLVDSVVEVTGTNAAEARHLLGACDNNLEAAIALYFEQGGGGGGASDSSDVVGAGSALAASASRADEMQHLFDANDDDVRAPIAPIREQLIGPEDDNFLSSSASSESSAARAARVAQQRVKVKVCPLRDFAREGALMEQQMQAAHDGLPFTASASMTANSSNGETLLAAALTNRRRKGRAAAMVTAATAGGAAGKLPTSATSRLCDLFRPPTDIAYAGTFQTARLRATELKHWLLVNVQSDNFDSQLLNRDVWSDKDMRRLIMRQFMLWQVDADSSEGRRFVAFYHCAKLPYVCAIDPRTGEEVWHSAEPNQTNLMPDLKRFLRDHSDFSKELADNMPSTSAQRSNANDCIVLDEEEEAEEEAGSSSRAAGGGGSETAPDGGPVKKRAKLLELSEEEQIALAIRNSMKENGNGTSGGKDQPAGKRSEREADDSGSDFDSLEEFVEDEDKTNDEPISAQPAATFEKRLGAAKDELTALKLRLLNTDGADEVIELRWPSDTPLAVLHQYIAQRHQHIAKQGGYKLICAYPRKTLESSDEGRSLKALGLHPSANLHLTLDD